MNSKIENFFRETRRNLPFYKSRCPIHNNGIKTTSCKAWPCSWLFLGGDKRDRTADLLNAIQALSQLSYTPTSVFGFVCAGPGCRRRCPTASSPFSQWWTIRDSNSRPLRCERSALPAELIAAPPAQGKAASSFTSACALRVKKTSKISEKVVIGGYGTEKIENRFGAGGGFAANTFCTN